MWSKQVPDWRATVVSVNHTDVNQSEAAVTGSPLIRLSRVVDTTQRYGERIRGQPGPSGLWFCDRRGEADYPVSSAKLLENTYRV